MLAFARAPGLLAVFGGIPGIGFLFFPVVWVWQLVTTVIAVRLALNYTSTLRAVGIVLIAATAYILLTLAFVVIVLSFGNA